ncbi:uncharacterized protein [Temnothorax nylanderi]|uniref:uncharacterized protein n=1 Tax=Temnothorax nylanderi TaxID=102681 RepID=UPI003A8A87B9
MSSDLENLLIAQGNAIDQLRRSLINFKKLPKAQVTLPKTKGRLTNLEGLWEKVQALHVQLLQTATAEEKKSTHYFKDEEFLAAEDAYLDATDHLHEVIASQQKPAAMWPHLRDLPLADPDPSCNHPIHVLIGADLYGSLLLDGLRQGPVGTPTGQLTIFGWILSGPVGSARPAGESASVLSCVSCEDTNSLIQSFWEDERIPSRTPLTEEDERCERHFATTHSRDSQGRYIVRLPFKNGPPRVGDTFRKASFLYSNMERQLARKLEIAAQYHDFLREYESMGHMESVRADERPPYPPIYIPHHFVLRESSTTTKLRVVFNASSASTDKTSLNDFLMAGPKLQQDIAAIILRWRLFRYVYMADIAKMFRQILVHRDDADYQRILWRPPDSLLIRLYRLLTVTYGQKPSPFLAQRSLIQLARDEGKDFPDAVNIIEESTYVDDVLFGADDLLSLLEKRKQLVGIMNRGCFPLRKWAANSAELLTDIPEDQRESSDYPINHDDTLKVLGLSWSPRDDSFRFVISPYAVTVHTKRSVLSFIAKLYDPLGWASPIVIAAKMLMQELWLRKIDWDAPIPDDLLHQWINYVSDLPNISKIRIPRWTGMRQDKIDVELHGFADASTRAYAAVVFLRIVHSPSNIQVILLAAKTKVAPLKTVSVPRLELNAVVLLIRLIEWIEACLNSRPISPLSDDPSDYTALTPGHFLIGRPLTSVPEESVLEINANRLSRWQHVQLMLEQIWRSWSSDYLHSLQQRVKWTESHDNPKVDEFKDIVKIG